MKLKLLWTHHGDKRTCLFQYHVLNVLLPHFEPLSSLERYFEKVFRRESAWKFIIESSEAATEAEP